MSDARETQSSDDQQAGSIPPAPTASGGTAIIPAELVDVMSTLAGVLERQTRSSSSRVTTFEEFKKLGPPNFPGTADPVEVEAWLRQIEKYFTVLKCSEEQKVTFAAFMLIKEADHWWQSTQRLLEGQETVT